MTFRLLLQAASLSLLLACSGSTIVSSTPDASSTADGGAPFVGDASSTADGGAPFVGDASLDAGCPGSAPTSGFLCTAPNQACTGPIACVTCGPGLWDREPVWDYFCSGGKWSCGIGGACIVGPATFTDSACTIPSPSVDASVDG